MSRLLWFIGGAAAATWWSSKHCDSSRRSSDGQHRNGQTDKDHMNAFGNSVTDMSEATLDTVITAVNALKTKLAEHRAQREQQQTPLGSEASGKSQLPGFV